ncbi:polysaccharide lyase family 7 protein [Gilvimarinus agarilyticus]|uniref:polysaccharide lyase family 7 protein n=1 Tax=Gilvimarinus agarilyticus TaxID=679259 RepID=UPI00059FDBC7|nr:polysaccharide lyase family 7 protein [Gilvimarinus agarilyticus]
MKTITSSSVFVLSMLAASAQAVNINNPGFESGFDGWVDDDPSALSGDAYSGSNSAKITGSAGRVDQQVSLNANTNYRLTAYVLDSGTVGVNLNGAVFDLDSDSDDWEKIEIEFNSGSNTSAEIFAKYHNGTGRFDDFSLVEVGGTSSSSSSSSSSSAGAGNCNNPINLNITDASDDGSHDGNGPDNAIDGSLSSRWSSQGDGKSITLDLGGLSTVTQLQTAWLKGDQRTQTFDVAVSENGNNWNTVLYNVDSQGSANLESFEIDDVAARYVKITGYGNTANDWNSLLEADVYGCGDADSGSSSSSGNSSSSSSSSSSGGSGNDIPDSITDGILFDLEGEDPHPLVNSSTLRFVPLEAKVTTPNGNGWRHEYKIKSGLRIAMTDTYELFEADIKVEMSDGGKTIVAQHHASDTGTIMKLYVSDSSESGFDDSVAGNGIFDVYVRLRNTSGNEEKYALGTIESGDTFDLRVINDYGDVHVYAMGNSFGIPVGDDSASYFKFGNYLQSQDTSNSEDCGESGDSDSFAQCFEELGITESTVTMTNVVYERIEN